MTEIEKARERLAQAALLYVMTDREDSDAREHVWNVEYATDNLDQAARELSSHLSATENTPEQT